MRIKHVATAAALCVACTAASAAVLLSEDFNDIGTLAGGGWSLQNLSPTPDGPGWFQGNPGVFGAQAGAAGSYIAGNTLAAGALGGTVSSWLFTPELSLATATLLEFQVRTGAIGLLDTVEVYYSASGASTSVGDFTLLGSYSNTDADQDWVTQQFNLAAQGGTGRFALRYFVGDTSLEGDYIGIDSLSVVTGTVPTPGSLPLAGLALVALGATTRRRKA